VSAIADSFEGVLQGTKTYIHTKKDQCWKEKKGEKGYKKTNVGKKKKGRRDKKTKVG